APGDRRADLRVTQAQGRRLQRRLRGAHVGFRLAAGVHALVELALGDGALVPQALRAVELALRIVQARLCGEDLRLRALDIGGVGRGVDGNEEVARLDQRPFVEVDGLHGPGNARAHVDA